MRVALVRTAVLACVASATAMSAAALGDDSNHIANKVRSRASASSEQTPFGRPGDRKRVSRTIRVDMNDALRFTPAELEVRQDDTVRFSVRNSGRTMHEMVLGTMAGLKEHQAMMKQHPGMQHDEPYMVHVAPGKSETIVWQFTRPGEFFYGCLIPGHLEGGMIGRVIVKGKVMR